MLFLLLSMFLSVGDTGPIVFDQPLVLEETEEHQIGSIRDLAADADHIYICDSRNKNVKVFDLSGRLKDVIGRRGQGPGEFEAPIAIAIDASHIYVGDPARSQVQIFDKKTLSYQRMFRTYDVMSLAVTANRIYVAAPHAEDDTSIHVYDLAGKHLRSFGAIPTVTKNHRLVSSSVAFDVNKDQVVVAHEMHYQIERFDLDGKSKGSIKGNHIKYVPPADKPAKKPLSRKQLMAWSWTWSHIRRLDASPDSDLIVVSYTNPKTEGETLDFYSYDGKPRAIAVDIDLRFLCMLNDQLIFFRDGEVGFELVRGRYAGSR